MMQPAGNKGNPHLPIGRFNAMFTNQLPLAVM